MYSNNKTSTEKFKEFFSTSYKDEIFQILENYPDERTLTVDYQALEIFDPDLADLLIEKPEEVLEAAQIAVKNTDPLVKATDISIKFDNVTNVMPFDKLNSEHVGKFISVDCYITDINKPSLILNNAVFECLGCMRLHEIEQNSAAYITKPSICSECGGRSFRLLQDESRYNDFQVIKVTTKSTSKILDVCLYNDDVSFDKYMIRQKINVTGIYKTIKTKNGFDPYFECNLIKFVEDEDTLFEEDSKEYGERNSPEYKEWAKQVLNRDKVCQCCGGEKHPHAHHIYAYHNHEDIRLDPDNGIILCKFCHKKFHSYYGRDNANPQNLIKFIRRFGCNNG